MRGRIFTGLIILCSMGMMSCSSNRLTTDSTYKEIKPKAQLPERQLRQIPENLVIRIENVADEVSSYSNFIKLFINGQEILPVEEISNLTKIYTFPMRLQHGIYEVKAEYHTVGFWKNKVFEIIPDEPVKVMPDQRTILTAKLVKDGQGMLAQNPTRFYLTYENLSSEVAEKPVRPVIEKKYEGPKLKPKVARTKKGTISTKEKTRPTKKPIVQPKTETKVTSKPEKVFSEKTVLLQINTSPTGANVIVDDKFYGQTPFKVSVTANHNHVLQISYPGYQEVLRIIDANELQNDTLFQFVFKMEPQAKNADEIE